MARKARRYSENGFYHVILRGIDKENIFYDARDKTKMLKVIEKSASDEGALIIAYCLMDNHFHLLLRIKSENISILIKKIASSYVYYFNRKYKRVGHLFQERFKSFPITDDAYLLVCTRYIHKNPEKAGMCKMEEYRWSSYKAYLSKETFVETNLVLQMLGGKIGYYDFMHSNDIDICEDYHDDKERTDEDINNELKAILGDDYRKEMHFVEREERDKMLITVKKLNISVRQASRVIGISRQVITAAWSKA